MKTYTVHAIVVVFAFGLGFLVSSLLYPHSLSGREVHYGTGAYTNPLLECDIAQGVIDARKQNFNTELRGLVAKLKQEDKISDIVVSFRDLNNGPAFGISVDDSFVPASLMKLPIAMAYYKRAEDDATLLDGRITFTKEKVLPNELVAVPEDQKLVVGMTYTVRDLIAHMLRYSDNQALVLLADTLPSEEELELFRLVGIDRTVVTSTDGQISARQMSSLFRILFNASFLSQRDSETVLSLLTETTFTEGIRSGVPDGVPVAHKFGFRRLTDGSVELHDCGIVYYPKHPYLLCIMTSGASEDAIASAIREVSGFVYHRIAAEYEDSTP